MHINLHLAFSRTGVRRCCSCTPYRERGRKAPLRIPEFGSREQIGLESTAAEGMGRFEFSGRLILGNTAAFRTILDIRISQDRTRTSSNIMSLINAGKELWNEIRE